MANYDFGFDQSYDIPSLRKKRFDDFGSFQMPDMGNLNPPDQSDPFDTGDQYQNLFKQNYQNPIADPSIQPPKPKTGFDPTGFMKMVDENYHPEHLASDRLNELISKYPQHEKPSLGRTLVASAAGLGGGAKAAYEVLDRPYVRDVAAWKDQTTPAYQAATNERNANANERTLLGNIFTASAASERNASAYENQSEKNRIAEEKNKAKSEVDLIRARAYAAKNAGWEIEDKGSRITAVNPITGERKDMGATGLMDQAELENLKGGWGVKRAEAAGVAANTVAATRNAGQEETARIRNQRPASGGTGASATQAKVARNNKFREVLDKHSSYAKFVNPPTSPNGDYTIKAPTTSGFPGFRSISPDEAAEFEQFKKEMGITNESSTTSNEPPASIAALPQSQANSSQVDTSKVPPGAEVQFNPADPSHIRYRMPGTDKWIEMGGKNTQPTSMTPQKQTGIPGKKWNVRTESWDTEPVFNEPNQQTRYNAYKGITEISTDDGKTWKPLAGSRESR